MFHPNRDCAVPYLQLYAYRGLFSRSLLPCHSIGIGIGVWNWVSRCFLQTVFVTYRLANGLSVCKGGNDAQGLELELCPRCEPPVTSRHRAGFSTPHFHSRLTATSRFSRVEVWLLPRRPREKRLHFSPDVHLRYKPPESHAEIYWINLLSFLITVVSLVNLHKKPGGGCFSRLYTPKPRMGGLGSML